MSENVILVVGSGKSGMAAVRLLMANGEHPVLFDSNEKLNKAELVEKLGINGVEVLLGTIPEEIDKRISMVVISPGVPIDSELVCRYRDRGIKISGEIELAFTYEKGQLLAVTGTNGKTTTTALLGKIMEEYTHKAFVVGNIGNPYTSEVMKTTEDSVTVAEISSFQLETVTDFHPHVAAILNITPDHLNRHHTMEKYIEEKEKISMNQGENDYIILNYEDEVTRNFAKMTKAEPVFFSSSRRIDTGFYYADDCIFMNLEGKCQKLINKDELRIIGLHNMENAMAAIAMAYVYGVPMEAILNSVRTFDAVEHRIEFVAEVNGVRYYNDSKGTNVDAAIKGIEAMDRKTCLIGGGYDKNSEYDEWIDAFNGKVKKLVLIGQTREKIAECAEKHGFSDYVFAETLEEAVNLCAKTASAGEAVLLSPACASWGMFDNYEQRGRMFKEYVKGLK